MKTLLSCFVVALFFCFATTNAQQQYTVEGKQYTLKTEVEGVLTLLWNTVNNEYRYFAKKGNVITELKNTKTNGTYQEEFKEALQLLTADAAADVSKLKLILPSLSNFFIAYNKAVDPSYIHETVSIDLKTRLGAFGGISNSVYASNPTNALTPVAGIDFEITENVRLRRHSVVLRFKQTFENSDTKYTASQLSLNYRFKFVKTPKFDVFINTKFVAWTHSKREKTIVNADTSTSLIDISGSSFSAPVAFGLGADYAIGNGYITFSYNDIVAIGVDNVDGNFPVDLTLGYKFNL